MKSDKPFLKGPYVWMIAAGVLVGAGATASVLNGKSSPRTSLPTPYVSVSSPKPVGQIRTSENFDMVRALDETFANLADVAKPAVVHIRVQNSAARTRDGLQQAMGGEGSGFIFRPDGYIVTNDHVVGGFEKVTVMLFDGREFAGTVLRAEDSDIAVVKIDANGLPTLPFADSSRVRSGQFAVAVGAPFGLESTVTVGHVSATARENQIPDPNTGRVRNYTDLIQTDAAINVGNSGGPLLNIDGEVIGINSAIFSPTGTSGGIGFAISSNTARLLAETLIEKGKVVRGFLGILPSNLKSSQAKALGVEKGAYVADLPSDGPAAMGGIKKGDVVIRINSLPIETQVDLRNAMIKHGPGSKLEIEVVRDRERKVFTVTAKEAPEAPNVLAPRTQQRRSNVPDIDIDDFPGFQDFPKVDIPDHVPNSRNGVRLGVEVGDVDETSRQTFKIPSGTKGAVVNSVASGSLAEDNDIKIGDVIVEVDGKAIQSAESLASTMRSLKHGDRKSVKILRFENGSKVELDREIEFK